MKKDIARYYIPEWLDKDDEWVNLDAKHAYLKLELARFEYDLYREKIETETRSDRVRQLHYLIMELKAQWGDLLI